MSIRTELPSAKRGCHLAPDAIRRSVATSHASHSRHEKARGLRVRGGNANPGILDSFAAASRGSKKPGTPCASGRFSHSPALHCAGQPAKSCLKTTVALGNTSWVMGRRIISSGGGVRTRFTPTTVTSRAPNFHAHSRTNST